MRKKTIFLFAAAAAALIVLLGASAPKSSPPKPSAAPASSKSPLDDLKGAMGGDMNVSMVGPGHFETDAIRLDYEIFSQNVDSGAPIIRAQSQGKTPIHLLLKEQKLTLECDDLRVFSDRGELRLEGRAKMTQKNEKGEETLNVSGETISIDMADKDQMKIEIRRSSRPAGPQARLKVRDMKGAQGIGGMSAPSKEK